MNRFKLDIQLFAEDVETTETKAEQKEVIELSMLERMKKLFVGDQKQEETQPTKTVEELAKEMAEKMAQDKLNEVIPKAKKQKEEELDAQKQALEKEKKELEQTKQLEQVKEEFKEFVKFKANENGKSIDEFLAENKQYMIDSKVTQTKFAQNESNGITLDGKQAEIYRQYEKAGIFKGGN